MTLPKQLLAAIPAILLAASSPAADADTQRPDYLAVGPEAMAAPLAPLLEKHRGAGLNAAFVPLAQATPEAVQELVERLRPRFLLLACPARGGQPTDDLHTLGHTVAVGRVPTDDPRAMAAWAAKAAAQRPSDNLLLLSDANSQADSGKNQLGHLDKVPSAFLALDGMKPDSARAELRALIRAGASTVVHQGQAPPWTLDGAPPSCWLAATCDTARGQDWLFLPGTGCVNLLAAAGPAPADQQDALVGRFLQGLRDNPDLTWGEMLNYLKRNLPFEERLMRDPKLPAFLRDAIPKEGRCVASYRLLGDPAAQILPEPRRGVGVEVPGMDNPERTLPPGPFDLVVTLNDAWKDAPRQELALRLRLYSQPDAWKTLPCPPLAPGRNQVPVDTAALGFDGGAFVLQALGERGPLPPTVWTEIQLRQANVRPPRPAIVAARTYNYADKAFTLMVQTMPQGFVGDRKALEVLLQVGKGQAPRLVKASAWQSGFQHPLTESYAKDGCLVRAKFRLNGREGDWADWTPLADNAPAPEAAEVFFTRSTPRFPLGDGLFAIPTPLNFGDEAQFQTRDQKTRQTLADSGWTRARSFPAKAGLEFRARLRQGAATTDWSQWKAP